MHRDKQNLIEFKIIFCSSQALSAEVEGILEIRDTEFRIPFYLKINSNKRKLEFKTISQPFMSNLLNRKKVNSSFFFSDMEDIHLRLTN